MKILEPMFDVYDRLTSLFSRRQFNPSSSQQHWILRLLFVLIAVLIVLQIVFGFLWNSEPDVFDPVNHANELSRKNNENMVTGYITAAAAIRIGETLLDKTGGYLTNDMTPPGVFMDNVPNWEFGALVQLRDIARALRNDISRSQSQSVEDVDLIIAEPQFNFDSDSWILPATESEYRDGLNALTRIPASSGR